MIAREPDRFDKVSMGNTGLPYNPDVPQNIIDEIKAFRTSNIKLTPMKMARERGCCCSSGFKIHVLAEILLGYQRPSDWFFDEYNDGRESKSFKWSLLFIRDARHW